MTFLLLCKSWLTVSGCLHNVKAVAAKAAAHLSAWHHRQLDRARPHHERADPPQLSEEERQRFATAEIPLGECGEPEDLANLAVFLASPRARYITGTVILVDVGLRRYSF